MSHGQGHTTRRFWVATALTLAAYLALPLPGQSASLQERIDRTQEQVRVHRGREAVLTQDVTRYGNRISNLGGRISQLQARQRRVQARLDRAEARLAAIRTELERTRDRLERLKARLVVATRALADRLVELYKADEPDALTVVLESDGFADLLERTRFLEMVSAQDRRIVVRVRELKRQTAAEARRLAGLEREAEATAASIRADHHRVAEARIRLVRSQAALIDARAGRRALLSRVRAHRSHVEGELDELEAAERRIQAQLSGSGGAPAGGGGPIRRGSRGLIWPVNGPIVSGFGQRWGRLHAGVDIAVPAGTPIRAAASGRVQLAGPMGGYGNYTCIGHGGGLSTCYAHQSRIGVSVGQNVSKGQVIGAVGNTGHSFGAHLHFEVRSGGSPVNPMGYL